MRTLAIAASARRGSINRHLLDRLSRRLEAAGHEMNPVDYQLFMRMPHYDFDVEIAEGLPAETETVIAAIERADAIVIAVPEYNHAIPGTLKNGIDWISRRKPSPLRGKIVLAASAASSIVGGWRGLQDLRLPLDALGAITMPDVVSIGGTTTAAQVDTRLAEPMVSARVDAALATFTQLVRQVTARG